MENTIFLSMQSIMNMDGLELFIGNYPVVSQLLILLMGLVACFAGIKFYRIFFSIFVYLFVVFTTTYFIDQLTDWPDLVVLILVLGLCLAFLSYNLRHIGAGVIVFFLMTMVVNQLTDLFPVALVIGLAFAVLCYFYSMETIMFVTSFWGALTFISRIMTYFNIESQFKWIAVIMMTLLGLLFQYILIRNQISVFKQRPQTFRRKQVSNGE